MFEVYGIYEQQPVLSYLRNRDNTVRGNRENVQSETADKTPTGKTSTHKQSVHQNVHGHVPCPEIYICRLYHLVIMYFRLNDITIPLITTHGVEQYNNSRVQHIMMTQRGCALEHVACVPYNLRRVCAENKPFTKKKKTTLANR